ncbi:MAG TPA: Gfo/Idh/MocA family oxidoreductase [Candidatus Ventrimonas merdavium]|nr:Gfo/Idh/MocA family oxidoreductase [Candidatus Ventrimonas merdavium]
MEQIRVALVGLGGMGRKYAELLAEEQTGGLVLQGVCCRNREGQELVRSRYPWASLYRDVEEMVSRAEEYDAVLIATPHNTHVEIGKQAFVCGKHVFCEKPLGISGAEVRTLLEAKRPETAFAVMFNNRALPAFRKAKELLDQKAVGRVTRAVWICNNWFRSPAYHRSAPWRSSWNGEQGGLLINQCQHYLDIWQWLFGMPDVIDADLDFGKYNDFQVEDGADVRLLYHGPKPAFRGTLISASGEHPGVNRLEIWGDKGRLTVEDGARVALERNVPDIGTFNRTNQEIFGQPGHETVPIELETEENTYLAMFRNFAEHLQSGAPLIAPGEEGLRSILLTNGAYLSAWTGEKVAFPMDEERYERLLAERRARETALPPGFLDIRHCSIL